MQRIREKLDRLRQLDADCEIFGASKHCYQLHAPLSDVALAVFEREFNVSLPDDYAAFLTQLGNGGAGPDYGIFSLANSVERFCCRQTWVQGRGGPAPKLDCEFPLTGATADLLIACYEKARGMKRFFNPHITTPHLLDGILDICERGCGSYVGIVLSGEQRGRVWGTGGPQGLSWCAYGPSPGSQYFLAWYEEWLDRWLAPGAIKQMRGDCHSKTRRT